MAGAAAPELRERLNAARFRAIGALLAECQPGFDAPRFAALASDGLESLTLLQRLRHGSRALHATLPPSYPDALAVLRILAPKLADGLAGLMLPDYVGEYGHGHFVESMDALEYLTRFSSAEFAIREFLRRDLDGTLVVMERWSRSPDEHVRRLASEGSRPRLPWSFRLEALRADPHRTAPILANLRADPSLYVRKSVANHLNDISHDHPDVMLARLRSWDLAHPHTQWIAKRAARTLIKAGHPGALALFNFGRRPAVTMSGLRVLPRRLRLGEALTLAFTLTSTARRAQDLAIDYVVHYVKASGATSAKVFKLRELALAPGGSVTLTKRQTVRNFTTRRHHLGRHRVEIQVNGRILGAGAFELRT